MAIGFTINGNAASTDAPPDTPLLWVIRDHLALTGVYDLLPIHTRHFYPGDITLSVGEPISTAGMTVRQTDELNAKLRETIQQLRSHSIAQASI